MRNAADSDSPAKRRTPPPTEKNREDRQASQMIAAWEYSLDTMVQEARSRKTCSWRIEGVEETGGGNYGMVILLCAAFSS